MTEDEFRREFRLILDLPEAEHDAALAKLERRARYDEMKDLQVTEETITGQQIWHIDMEYEFFFGECPLLAYIEGAERSLRKAAILKREAILKGEPLKVYTGEGTP